jgi:hypothetical protein
MRRLAHRARFLEAAPHGAALDAASKPAARPCFLFCEALFANIGTQKGHAKSLCANYRVPSKQSIADTPEF